MAQNNPNWKDNILPGVKSKDDPRYIKMAEKRDERHRLAREHKANKAKYKQTLADFKASQHQEAQDRIASGEIPSPMEVMLEMIKEQTIIVANPGLDEAQPLKERTLLMQMNRDYAMMTGANAPSSQSVDVTSESVEEQSPEEVQAELLKITDKLKIVGGKDAE